MHKRTTPKILARAKELHRNMSPAEAELWKHLRAHRIGDVHFRLLLYFSGHGIRDDRGQLFLAVRDTEHKLLRGTAIPAAFITEEMDHSRSKRQVLILDCCHSGAFARGMKAATGTSAGTAAAFEGKGLGRVVLTATDSTQYAWEGDRVIGQAENSVFTHYLIQGLRTGEADHP